MTARATDEPHRASSQLELLFDLTFVVAISRLTAPLADRIANGEGLRALTPFLQVFFAIWWAWMNFTWFASSYDTDDVGFRLLTLLQMVGVLVLAAGVPTALNNNDFLAVTVGYLILRVGLVALWLRVAIEDSASRAIALRYAAAIASLGIAWMLGLVLAEVGGLSQGSRLSMFVGLVVLELSVPLWLERKRRASWHPHHIAERYGLFAIILLGECIFAGSSKVETAVAGDGVSAALVTIAVAGLVVVFALWWLYFLEPAGEGLARNRDRAFLWGCFGQYGVFAALAGFGAGLEVAIDQAGNHLRVSPIAASYAVAAPVGLFLVLVWAVATPIVDRSVVRPVVILGAAAVILILPLSADFTGAAAVLAAIAVVCATMIAAILKATTQGARRHELIPCESLVGALGG
jgi:low temperature requirement protein LtrA